MTERELSQAVHLKTELDALRRVAAMLASDEDTLQAIASRALDVCDGRGIEVTGTDRRRKK